MKLLWLSFFRLQSSGLRSVEDELAIRRSNPDMLDLERFPFSSITRI